MTTTQPKQFLYNNKPLTDAQKMTLLLTGELPKHNRASNSAATAGTGSGIHIGNKLDKSQIAIVNEVVKASFKQKNGRRTGARVIVRVWRKSRFDTLNRLRKKMGKGPLC